jgi:hypothetical protein
MAELELGQTVLNYNRSGVKRQLTVPKIAVDLAADTIASGSKSIATSATQITGLPTTPGLVVILNTDTTNYVRVGVDGTNWVVKLFPYDSAAPDLSWAVFPLAGTTLYAIANSAACKVEYFITPIAA